jgi:hypothetical protein
MTERCRDPQAFVKALREGGAAALATHIRDCPVCRKVVTDALKALVSDGIPFEPSSELKSMARRILASDEGEGRVVIIRAGPGRAPEISGAEGEIVARGSAVRFDPEIASYALAMEVEPIEGRFLLRLIPKGKTGALGVLRNEAGAPVVPPRKLDAALSWAGLISGKYRLSVAGSDGVGELGLWLNWQPEATSERS